ncbi:hypothetical protein ILYODFUR_017904 [Ilyodon furcidens]|uniref:Uncharacterized protein n=1 Tax=Ilyodon furcidens TaxID=33524 RepID=A0ABV0T0M2_9TELE
MDLWFRLRSRVRLVGPSSNCNKEIYIYIYIFFVIQMDQIGNMGLNSSNCLISPPPAAQQLHIIPSAAAAAACTGAPPAFGRWRAERVLPGLPQSAHISLPGLASTSCSRSLFPSASSAMVPLSVQPHRGGVKPVREHPPLEFQTDRAADHLSPPM